jgi:hypothetical protein
MHSAANMTTEQVLPFADALPPLPPLPRGIFIEGWRPADPLPLVAADALTRRVTEDLAPHVMLAAHTRPRDAAIMRDQLPPPPRPLWPQA